VTATTATPQVSADGPLGPSAERLRDEAVRFLRRFGLVAAGWSTLLAATAPQTRHPTRLWIGVALLVAWACAALAVRHQRIWWFGWVVAASGAELLGPIAGTDGWSITGGATMIVLAGAALSGRTAPVIGAVAWLSAVAATRSLVGDGWRLGDAVGTSLLFGFGGLALAWVVRIARRSMDERDALAADLSTARAEAARREERDEAAAQLHDTVLQHLTAVGMADDLGQSRDLAARAANELRTFLRSPGRGHATLRAALEDAVTSAAGGAALSIGGTGDRPIDEATSLLVDAATEAVRNAAKHAASAIRVFIEVEPEGPVTVWVTDHGPGFDRNAVPPDRLGIRGSIEERLARAGGHAGLRSGKDGTEWELRVPGPA